jgi:hypothetical protein
VWVDGHESKVPPGIPCHPLGQGGKVDFKAHAATPVTLPKLTFICHMSA